MSEPASLQGRRRRRRADAERSSAAILGAAARVLGERPEASLEEVATAAGVTRQTVYAHYPSRESLLSAVLDRVTADVVETLDAAEPDAGQPAAALVRLLEASWRAVQRYPFLFHTPPMSAGESHERHGPILDRFERLIRRGQRTGDFDRRTSPTWLLAATIGLAHAAGEEVGGGRMTADDAADALVRSVLRVLGVDDLARDRATGQPADGGSSASGR